MTNSPQKPKRKRAKFTGSARITLAAVSVAGFVGGWNLIARLEEKEAQANEPQPVNPEPLLQPASHRMSHATPSKRQRTAGQRRGFLAAGRLMARA